MAETSIRVSFWNSRGALARMVWCPSPARLRATVDEAEPDLVCARVVWPDGSSRELNRPALGAPWIAGPRRAAEAGPESTRQVA